MEVCAQLCYGRLSLLVSMFVEMKETPQNRWTPLLGNGSLLRSAFGQFLTMGFPSYSLALHYYNGTLKLVHYQEPGYVYTVRQSITLHM